MFEISTTPGTALLAGRREFRHHGGMSKRQQRAYDHRLVRLVQQTGDVSIATRAGGPG